MLSPALSKADKSPNLWPVLYPQDVFLRYPGAIPLNIIIRTESAPATHLHERIGT
jgi:hypothetical protein